MPKKKILIIEDNRALVTTLRDMLNSQGMEVELALDAKIGFEKAKKIKPNLIVLDIMLPGESGFTCLAELKKHAGTKKIPVLILSNLGQTHEVREGIKMGAEAYLVKAEYSIQEIGNRIKELVK